MGVSQLVAIGLVAVAQLSAVQLLENAIASSQATEYLSSIGNDTIVSSDRQELILERDRDVKDAHGLSFEGILEGLEVTRTAVNKIAFDLVFNDGTPAVSVDYQIATGQDEIASWDEQILVVFSVTQTEYIGSAEDEEIIGNSQDNTIDGGGGRNTIKGNEGNDRSIVTNGKNVVDGGEGIDTARIDKTRAEAGEVSKIGKIVRIGTDNTLLNVEFIEFSDVRLAVDTLTVTPILTVTPTLPNGMSGIIVTEGDIAFPFEM